MKRKKKKRKTPQNPLLNTLPPPPNLLFNCYKLIFKTLEAENVM